MCSPESIPLTKTIGLINTVRFPNGNCINKNPIPGFTECIGSCHSATEFNTSNLTIWFVCFSLH